MNRPDCAAFHHLTGAFVDGELTGAERLALSLHLAECSRCEAEVEAFRSVGDALRMAAFGDETPARIEGLAAGVISRTRAESAASWWSVVQRASEDWHWTIVGAGSVAATFASAVLLSVILAFGPNPERQDSLAGIFANMSSPAGVVWLKATPQGRDQDAVLIPVSNDEADSIVGAAPVTASAAEDGQTEAELVGALANAVTRNGRVLPLDRMEPTERHEAELLLTQINRKRFMDPAPIGNFLEVHEVHLVTSTNVSAKGT